MPISRLEEWFTECEREYVDAPPLLHIVPTEWPMSSAGRREYVERLECVAMPSDVDLAWMRDALRDERRKWFAAYVARHARTLSDSLLAPILDAAVDEIDPSYNKLFVDPCVRAFGRRRVQTYLLDVLRTGTDFQKAGAVNALLWAAGGETDDERASLADLRQQRRVLLLELFVTSTNIDVQRCTYRWLSLDPSKYPEEERPLVERAITVARRHQDPFIRDDMEQRDRQKAGKIRTSSPLPERTRR